MSATQVSAAGAYARADSLVVTIPVRPTDPTRPRFQVRDQVAADQTGGQVADELPPDDQSSGSGGQGAAARGARGGVGLLGAVTSFLARMFAQSDTDAPSAPMRTGAQAYARASSAAAVAAFDTVDIVSPSFPRLSSGRALDLTV